MDLGNLFEVVVHHFQIGGMAGLSYQDGVLIMSPLVCIVIHWTRPTMSHDIRPSSSHIFTKLLYCIVSQP